LKSQKTRCVICGTEITYTFGRPRKVCSNLQCQKALQKLRARKFKLKKKKLRGEAINTALRAFSIDSYEPTIYNTDLGNLLNIGKEGSLKVIPYYHLSIFNGYKEPTELTLDFMKDSIAFYQKHPELVRYPKRLKPNPKTHRIGVKIPNIECSACGCLSLHWRSEGGWFCPECGNEVNFSLPLG
jgi:hypothetical protein